MWGLGMILAVSPGLDGRPISFGKKNPAGEETSRPETSLKPSERIIHSSDTINRKVLDSRMARVNGDRAPIAVSERKEKEVKVFETREVAVIENTVRTRPGDEVVIPRMSQAEFQRILRKYQQGMDEPVETLKTEIEVGEDGVSLDDINKYSNPADRLDDQGIPVERAGSGEDAKD